ncbi:MAG: glycosyl transferase family 1 [Bacteroidetes bacterium]|nr:glycosyl transferase family 1 [Bacteroidota bacterium]
MNVLVFAYYFPPLGLSGVQRIAKFVKYLPAYNWTPYVVTPEPAAYFARDSTLLDEVLAAGVSVTRTASLDPTRLPSRRVISQPTERVRKALSGISQFVFIPDNKIGWLRAATNAGRGLLAERAFDAIISTAPPYTAHLAGARLSREFDLPLILDYRDDWIGNPRHSYPTPAHRYVHRRLESSVIKQAANVVAINDVIADAIERRHRHMVGRVHVLSQGFDPGDLQRVRSVARDEMRCEFFYGGVFYDAQRPDTFLHAVSRWVAENEQHRKRIQITFAGILPEYAKALAASIGIDDLLVDLGYLSHRDLCDRLMAADILWMTIGRTKGSEQISTGKLYEYMGTRKPILALVPPGTARRDLDRYSASFVVDPDDIEGTTAAIDRLFTRWSERSLPTASVEEVARFDRRELAGRLAALLDETRSKKPFIRLRNG